MIRVIGGTGMDVADGLSQQSIGGSYNEAAAAGSYGNSNKLT